MPPTIWNKYSLSLILSKLIAGKASIVAVAPDSVCPTFDARKNRHEIVNGFIVFVRANEAFSFDHMFGNIRRKEDPSLFALNKSVPGTRGKWINVHSSAGTLGTD
jgi:hypothetical protein